MKTPEEIAVDITGCNIETITHYARQTRIWLSDAFQIAESYHAQYEGECEWVQYRGMTDYYLPNCMKEHSEYWKYTLHNHLFIHCPFCGRKIK